MLSAPFYSEETFLDSKSVDIVVSYHLYGITLREFITIKNAYKWIL